MINKNKRIFIFAIILSLSRSSYSELHKFNDIFQIEKEIYLQTKSLEIVSLWKIRINFYNNPILLDLKGSQVVLFGQEGNFLKRIGRKGQGPGEFILPISLEVDKNGNIFISDNPTRRINIYDKNGVFKSSFINSGSHMTPETIKIGSRNDIFFGAYKEDFNNPGKGYWINKYNSEGKYIKSFIRRNTEQQQWMLGLDPSFCFDIDKEDIIYSAQVNDYNISVYDAEGSLIKSLAKAPYYFKKPDPDIKVEISKITTQSEAIKILDKLSKSWTRICDIVVVKNTYLLLILETNNLIEGINSKYIIDIWDKKGNLIRGGIQTDYKYLCMDYNDYLYFLTYTDEEQAVEKDATYRIGKFKLGLN